MTRFFFLLTILFFIFPAWSGNNYHFQLKNRSAVDQEILSAEVFAHHQLLGGKIKIIWHRNDIDSLAVELKNKLIVAGVPITDIYMDKNNSYQTTYESGLINIKIEPYKQLYPCDYHYQYYTFKNDESIGCALKNNLYSSLINKDKRFF